MTVLEKTTISQKEAILQHMRTNGTITPMEALERYGCFRLGARIWELEKEDHIIEHSMGTAGGKRFAVYKLIKSDKTGQLSIF